jgi:hypothetical protein
MSTCLSDPKYLLKAAQASLSPKIFEMAAAELAAVAALHPSAQGVENQCAAWRRCFADHGRSLVWC